MNVTVNKVKLPFYSAISFSIPQIKTVEENIAISWKEIQEVLGSCGVCV